MTQRSPASAAPALRLRRPLSNDGKQHAR